MWVWVWVKLRGLEGEGEEGMNCERFFKRLSWYSDRSWMKLCRDSEANSESARRAPGRRYERERREDSIVVMDEELDAIRVE